MGESDRWDRCLVKWESGKDFLACKATSEGLKEEPHREQEQQPTQSTSDRQQQGEGRVVAVQKNTVGTDEEQAAEAGPQRRD